MGAPDRDDEKKPRPIGRLIAGILAKHPVPHVTVNKKGEAR